MQTITLHETIGDDGILRLQMPAEPRGAPVEVVVVIQPQTDNDDDGAIRRPTVLDFAGILTDDTFEIPEDLPLDDILVIE